MPNIDIYLPKGKGKGLETDIDASLPSVDISLPKGKIEGPEIDIEGPKGRKFKMPHLKMPDVDISLPKVKGVGPEVEMEGALPSIDVSLPKGKLEGPDVDLEGSTGAKFKMPGIKMPKVDLILPKGKVEGLEITTEMPEAHIEGSAGGKFKNPNINMPSVDISLPKGNVKGPKVDFEASKSGKFKMPDVDISLPKGSIEGPELEIGGKSGGIKMPHPKTKGPAIDIGGPEVHLEVQKKGTFEMPNIKRPDVDISLPKLKIEGPDLEAEGAKLKMPEIKMPNIDISLPKRKGKGLEADIDVSLPSVDISLPKGKIEGPEITTERPESHLEGSKGQCISDDGQIKAKVKGTKFNIGMPKMKLQKATAGADPTIDPTIPGHSSNLEGNGVRSSAPKLPFKVGLGSESNVSAQTKVPSIPDIDFDIDLSQEDENDQISQGTAFKIPKFGVPLPSLSSPEGRLDFFGQEFHNVGPKVPKVKRAVFVLVNPEESLSHSPKLLQSANIRTGTMETQPMSNKQFREELEQLTGKRMEISHSFLPTSKPESFHYVTATEKSVHVTHSTETTITKNEQGTLSGQIKLPQVQITSPSIQLSQREGHFGVGGRVGAQSSMLSKKAGEADFESTSGTLHLSKEVVTSDVRRERGEGEGSASPPHTTTESSSKTLTWAQVVSKGTDLSSEDKESSPWFRVPKFNLKPHSTGFLQITPEGSPQAQRRGEVGGDLDVSGSFCLHTSGISSEQVFEEQHTSTGVSSPQAHESSEGTVTLQSYTRVISRHTTQTDTPHPEETHH
ncbi:hypothetical protein WMY93_028190 [Mugilogobius chulae]|uniref:Uncharacterized protein n=1 Tax=Mugilogobius chulae TaxID=88201 RepID=A0AAW0MTV6_9GOBI